MEYFSEHFKKAGIEEVVKLRQAQENTEHRRTLRGELEKLFLEDGSPEEIVTLCQQHMGDTNMTDVDITIMVRYAEWVQHAMAGLTDWSL